MNMRRRPASAYCRCLYWIRNVDLPYYTRKCWIFSEHLPYHTRHCWICNADLPYYRRQCWICRRDLSYYTRKCWICSGVLPKACSYLGELLVRWTLFGQFAGLYFVSWLTYWWDASFSPNFAVQTIHTHARVHACKQTHSHTTHAATAS